MKVLVGIDGSSNSLATVAFAGRLVDPGRDQLVLAHVSPPTPFLGDDQLDPGVVSRAQGALANAVIEEAAMRLPEEWHAKFERREASGEPGQGLLRLADELYAELIAVGFRGTGMFERLLLGSVSRAIVHSAHVPVLVVKTTGGRDSEKVAGTPDGTFRVLAAYDGSDFGAKIAALVGKLSWPDSTRGWALTAVPPMFHHQLPAWMKPVQRDPDVQAMAEAWQKEFDQQLQVAVKALEKFQQTLPASFQGTEPMVAQGHPAEQILAAIDRQKVDLAIVGSRGHGAVERLLVGSTSARVVNEAPCSVLVAR
jgi:nucleotide-binding universal stress UspA family protein